MTLVIKSNSQKKKIKKYDWGRGMEEEGARVDWEGATVGIRSE